MYVYCMHVFGVFDCHNTNLSLGQGVEQRPLKCCRCNSILGSVMVEDISIDALDVNCSDGFSIQLYKHSISLRSSNLFRYGLCH